MPATNRRVQAMRYHATRPPLRRMKAVDQTLRAGRWPTDKSLVAELEADPRTIRRDLEYMRNQLKAPIAFSRAQRGYYYSEDTYRLPFLQLSEGELLSLYFSERMLHQFRETPFEPELRRVIDKLAEMLPDSVTVRLDAITDFLSVLPAVHAQYDQETFCTMLRAVISRRRLTMV